MGEFDPSRMQKVRDLLAEVLKLLDEDEAPGEIGAHLDHCICQLDDWIEAKLGRSIDGDA